MPITLEDLRAELVALRATSEERERNLQRQREEDRAAQTAHRLVVDQRLGSLEDKVEDWLPTIHATMQEIKRTTDRHELKATCINGASRLLQGAGLTGGTGGGLVAIYLLLKELGVL